MTTIPDLSGLTDDGDTVDLGDGHTLRLRIEGDPYTYLDDYDWYGRVDLGQRNPDTGYNERPRDFDGNAEKIDVIYGPIWWQPPADVARGSKTFTAIRQTVRDIVSFGYSVYILEHLYDTDAYGCPIVRAYATIGGVEPFPDTAYVRSLVSDLYVELDDELNVEPATQGAVR